MRHILHQIWAERQRQNRKWPSGIATGKPSPEMMVCVLTEECGEVARAVHDGDRTGLREELIQVAAVAVAAVECLDAGGWPDLGRAAKIGATRTVTPRAPRND